MVLIHEHWEFPEPQTLTQPCSLQAICFVQNFPYLIILVLRSKFFIPTWSLDNKTTLLGRKGPSYLRLAREPARIYSKAKVFFQTLGRLLLPCYSQKIVDGILLNSIISPDIFFSSVYGAYSLSTVMGFIRTLSNPVLWAHLSLSSLLFLSSPGSSPPLIVSLPFSF